MAQNENCSRLSICQHPRNFVRFAIIYVLLFRVKEVQDYDYRNNGLKQNKQNCFIDLVAIKRCSTRRTVLLISGTENSLVV